MKDAFRMGSLSLLVSLILGCSTPPVREEFSFNQRPQDAYDCALSAARSIGLGIESSDAASGVFAGMTIEQNVGGLLGSSARQYYFAIDKLTKTVSVRVESYNQINTDVAPVRKLVQDFQVAFKRRCP